LHTAFCLLCGCIAAKQAQQSLTAPFGMAAARPERSRRDSSAAGSALNSDDWEPLASCNGERICFRVLPKFSIRDNGELAGVWDDSLSLLTGSFNTDNSVAAAATSQGIGQQGKCRTAVLALMPALGRHSANKGVKPTISTACACVFVVFNKPATQSKQAIMVRGAGRRTQVTC
jgi:hypothetical protein